MTSHHNEYYSNNPNLYVVNYFEAIVNEVDLKCETTLADLEAKSLPDDETRQTVNEIRENFIDEIKRLERRSLDRLRRENICSSEFIRAEHIFNSGFCFLVDKSFWNEEAQSIVKDKQFELGVLVVANEYIELDEIGDLKKLWSLGVDDKTVLTYFFEIGPEIKTVSINLIVYLECSMV